MVENKYKIETIKLLILNINFIKININPQTTNLSCLMNYKEL